MPCTDRMRQSGLSGEWARLEHVERLLEIAVVGERAAIGGEQRLVAGMGDGGLFEHGDGLGALPGGAQRLAVAQRGLGILGIGAIALAIDFGGAARIGIGDCGSAFERQRARDVGHGLAAAKAGGQDRRHGRGRQEAGQGWTADAWHFNSRVSGGLIEPNVPAIDC